MSSSSFPKLAKGPPSRCANGWTNDAKGDRHTGTVDRLGSGDPSPRGPGRLGGYVPGEVILWRYPNGGVGWGWSWRRGGGCCQRGWGDPGEPRGGVAHLIDQPMPRGPAQYPRGGHDGGVIGPIDGGARLGRCGQRRCIAAAG